MSGFLKFVIGIAVLLGVVGLVGLGVLGMFVAVPVASHSVVVQGEEIPARVAEVRAPERGDYEVSNFPVQTPVNASTQWGEPAQVQVNVHDSWMDGAESFTGVILLFGLPAITLVVILAMRRRKLAGSSDDPELVHELARRAQDLSQRMEALETILLDRTRVTR